MQEGILPFHVGFLDQLEGEEPHLTNDLMWEQEDFIAVGDTAPEVSEKA